jgi:hypothetical protein
MKSANFIGLSDYSVFTTQTDVGTIVTAELKREIVIESVLLEMSFDFNDPENFEMKFSNRLRLDDHNFIFSDLIGSAVGSSSSVSFNGGQWSNWNDNYKDDVSTFINSSLNATLNKLINSTKQEIVIDTNGLKGRRKTGNTYDPKQVWLTSSILAFTNDNWSTAKAALGNISIPGGGTAYGLVADVIVGRLLAGNSLRISNEANNFILDNTGAFLNNASLTVTKTNSRIYIDPSNGIKIQKNSGGTWTDMFKAETNGDLTFAGRLNGATGSFTGAISAASGTIGGWTINSLGISDSFGNYINSNGEIHIGALRIQGSNSQFDGDIYANRIFGEIQDSQIAPGLDPEKLLAGLDAAKVTFGVLGASVITTGEIRWAGDVRMYPYDYGWAVIQTPQLGLVTPNAPLGGGPASGAYSMIRVSSDGSSNASIILSASLSGSSHTYFGISDLGLTITASSLYMSNNAAGMSGSAESVVLDPTSLSMMKFVNGILVEYA